MTYRSLLVGWLAAGLVAGTTLAANSLAGEKAEATALGEKVPNTHSLRDLRGNRRALHDFKGNQAIVLAFLGTECPIANVYVPRLIRMEKEYRPKKVLFLAVYPNEYEDLDQVAGHAYDRDIPFPVLKDFRQRFADAVGITRTPAVAVLDGDLTLRYRGRIDDQYGASFRKKEPTRADLKIALDEVLAGKKVSVPRTEADGCLLDRGGKAPTDSDVTYTRDVAPILQKRCQSCHRPGQPTPFSLLDYDDARRRGAMLKEVTTQRRMPPWLADPRYGEFANCRRMPTREIDTLAAWVDSGMKRGDPKDLPEPIKWPGGWRLGKPDLVVNMPEAFKVPAEGVLPYKYYTVQTHFKEDRWVQMAEAQPGAADVVHHVVVYILEPGQRRPFRSNGAMSVLVGWAPGDLPLICPPGTALRIPKDSRLLFELHYTPNGKEAVDRSRIGITFAKKPPKREIHVNAFLNEEIVIPPNAPHHAEHATFRLQADARIISFVPHMHWRGKHYRYEAILPDGKRKTLLSVPRWDFNWQCVYFFKDPIRLPKGTRLHAVAHWDNSKNNPYNPDPSKRVKFGLQTWDEMMVGWVAYVWEKPGTQEELAKHPPDPADTLFDHLDRNADEVVTRDEVPPKLLPYVALAGLGTREKVGREEFREIYKKLRKAFGRNRDRRRHRSDGEKKPDAKKGP
jgi:hypothetical protein